MKKQKSEPRFHAGETVRVKNGICDPDYPDIPLGGRVGAVKEVDRDRGQYYYLITWTAETLKNIPEVARRRSERDGLDYKEMTLTESDIEAYDGCPLSMEQPTRIDTRSLSPDDQDDRIRMILGATSDDPVPDVDEETLLAYRKYLIDHLTRPFEARHCPEDGPESDVTVLDLSDPDEYDCDEFYGLFCKARLGRKKRVIPLGEIEVRKGKPNHQLIDDYSYWFWNWR